MKLYAPQIDNILYQLERTSRRFDRKMFDKLQGIYSLMGPVRPEGDDQVRSLWIEVPRENIEDFGDYKEFKEEGIVNSRKDFEAYWISEYPDQSKWYQFTTAEYRDKRYFYFNSQPVFTIDQSETPVEDEDHHSEYVWEFLFWLEDAIKYLIFKIKQDEDGYNEFLSDHLSYHKRKGRIGRRACWEILGDDAILLDERLGPQRIDTLRRIVDAHNQDGSWPVLKDMTAADFLRFCEICYDANDYYGESGKALSPVEKYHRMADGRDGGLLSIDPDSSREFRQWYQGGERLGAHPWEICRGGNSTHITLGVSEMNNGWSLMLDGSSVVRVEETVRMAVALHNASIPFHLREAQEIFDMVSGNDFIGIVPDTVFPRYCHSLFPEEDKIIDFMNLGYENTEEIIAAARWYPLDRISVARS
ncbi:MAG TPA: hypothetical protein ENO20_03550 [Bacteroides sp.]|nr:hypothetical protein [Bacteroides sp.]